MHRELRVVHKCANSNCETPFLYFRSGKLFQFPRPEKRVVEAFWLCGICSQAMTLEWNVTSGVVLSPKTACVELVDLPRTSG